MGADYYLNKISRSKHSDISKMAKARKMYIEDFYGNIAYEELILIGDWSNCNYFSVVLKNLGIKSFDCCQIEITKEMLERIKTEVIIFMESQFKKFVIDVATAGDSIRNWDYNSKISRLTSIVEAINDALKEVDFETEMVLYHESL